MLWLGLDPSQEDVLNANSRAIVACSMYLDQAAETGDLRYYDKRLFQERHVEGIEDPVKVFSYTYTVRSLTDFAKIKGHPLRLLDEKAGGSNGSPLPDALDRAQARTAELEREVARLKAEAEGNPRSSPRDSSLIATIGALLAVWPGGTIPSGKDLEKAAQSVGLNISDDTIRKALKAAHEAAPSLPLPK